MIRFLRRLWLDTSLKNKLLASYILVLLVPMVLLSAYEISSSRSNTIENATSMLSGLVEKSQESFLRKIEQLEAIITFCTYESGLQTVYKNRYPRLYDLYIGLSQYMTPILNSVMASHAGDAEELLIYSSTGLQTYGSYMRNVSEVMDDAWYQEAIVQSGIQWHLKEGRFYATCRIDPINRLLGREPMGILYLQLKWTTFLSRYLEINWPAYQLAIHGPDGELFYEGTFGAVEDAEKPLTFVSEWPREGWRFVYTVPLSSVFSQGNTLGVNVLLILVSLVTLIVLVLILSRTLFRGIERLHSTMARVQAGELEIQIQSEARDEVGMLTESFSAMLSSIRALIEQTKENERQMSNLALKALRAQIDPHFLYNTLSYINWKAVRAGQMEISHVINQLSIFYRTCLNKGMELTSIGDEIANTRAYLEIQLLLHNQCFDVLYDVPNTYNDLKMPGLILQPLVENAIVHGIDQMRQGRGQIRISLAGEGGALVFTITDNGPGVSAVTPREKAGSGYGLTNVQDRIRLHYGEGYGIVLEDGAEGGCEAVVRIPLEPLA